MWKGMLAVLCVTGLTACQTTKTASSCDMGNLFNAERDVEASIAACDELIAGGGSAKARSHVHQTRGAFLAKAGRLEEAEADFDAAIALTPEAGTAYVNRGNYYSLRGDRERAMANYETALELDPEDNAAMNNMAWELAKYGDYQAAADIMATVLVSVPYHPGAHDTSAHALMGLGRQAEAEAAFERAAELGGPNRVRRYQAALVAAGYDPGRTDGVFDAATRAALSACVRDNCRLMLN